jgi:O-antigen ligase
MQTAQPTYSTWQGQRTPAAAMPNSGLFAYVRGLSLTAWLFSLLFGFYYITDWGTQQELWAEGFDVKKYFYFGFGAVLLAHLTLGIPAWLAAPFQMVSTWAGGLLTAFCCWMLILSPLSVAGITSLVYAGATWVAAVMLWLFWTSNYRVLQRSLLVACWVQFAWWTLLLAKHGLPSGFGGNIGDINRNITGTAALAALICGLFTPYRYLRWAACGFALLFIVIVTSRGSMVALAVFTIVYITLYRGVARSALAGGIFGFLALLFILAVPTVREKVSEKVFHIHDKGRGIGSGFTGRTEMWAQGIEWFWKKPVLGYGFRSTTHGHAVGFGGVHSAYIKIFLEAGIIGAFLILAAVVIEAYRRMRIALHLRSLRPQDLPDINIAESLRLNVMVCATMCLVLTMWVYDQYYINLGSPISVMFFLMLMAPVYVTKEGRTLRALS